MALDIRPVRKSCIRHWRSCIFPGQLSIMTAAKFDVQFGRHGVRLVLSENSPFPFGTAVFKLKCLRLALGIHASQDFQTATGVTVTGTFNLYKQKRLRFKSEWRFAAPVSHQSPSRSSVVFQWYDTHCTIVCSNVNISLQSKISLRN